MKRRRSEESCSERICGPHTYDERAENCWLCRTTWKPTATDSIGQFKNCELEDCQSLGPGLLDQSKQAELLYTPIEEWRTSLLALKPGEYTDPLVADLRVSHLVYARKAWLEEGRILVDYDALSYCWGEPNFNGHVRCNGIAYPITENLYLALERLRRKHELRYLWIDALCINQRDASEKSAQVCRMLSKYRQAKTVVVWLGEHGEHTETAILCLRASGGYAGYDTSIAELCESHQTEFSLGILDLFNRPWYKQLWVKQEISAAARIDYLCADSSLPWHVLTSIVEEGKPNIEHHHNRLQERQIMHEHQDPIDGFVASPNLLAPASHPRTFADLISVIYRSSGSICSDPRGLRVWRSRHDRRTRSRPSLDMLDAQSTESTAPFLPVDYARPIAQVFSDVIRYYIQHRKNLVFFEYLCGKGNCMTWPMGGHVGGESLPTWCPKWSAAPCEGPLQMPGRPDALHSSNNVALRTDSGKAQVDEFQTSSNILSATSGIAPAPKNPLSTSMPSYGDAVLRK
ncbi:hypothetical protein LTR37_015816 [Vermiconidia calcicola]|uniref:Uncharacterized protein n=1 Tax=Vermiconidia calcicola TaxID=1690605 RepID=A0ACC3MPU2_9PEZI|nr:hypothetical protein LTR37_015816 [Vermiconidia calcicola]